MAIAFMPSSFFNRGPDQKDTGFPLWTSVDEVRRKFREGTKVMVAIGGWGDTVGFEEAARSEEGRVRWAENVRVMVEESGADGMSCCVLRLSIPLFVRKSSLGKERLG